PASNEKEEQQQHQQDSPPKYKTELPIQRKLVFHLFFLTSKKKRNIYASLARFGDCVELKQLIEDASLYRRYPLPFAFLRAKSHPIASIEQACAPLRLIFFRRISIQPPPA